MGGFFFAFFGNKGYISSYKFNVIDICLFRLGFLIQGMGYSKFAILAGVFEMAARTLVGFVFVPMFGYPAACFASPVAWIFADCFLFPAYFHVLKKTKKMLSEPVRTSVA